MDSPTVTSINCALPAVVRILLAHNTATNADNTSYNHIRIVQRRGSPYLAVNWSSLKCLLQHVVKPPQKLSITSSVYHLMCPACLGTNPAVFGLARVGKMALNLGKHDTIPNEQQLIDLLRLEETKDQAVPPRLPPLQPAAVKPSPPRLPPLQPAAVLQSSLDVQELRLDDATRLPSTRRTGATVAETAAILCNAYDLPVSVEDMLWMLLRHG